MSADELLDQLPVAWRAPVASELDAKALARVASLAAFLEEEEAAGAVVLPPAAQRFAALEAVAPKDVRVVILGQDPYPTPGHAHGLAFSYVGDGTLPRSLRNIFEEVARDTGVETDGSDGDLMPWARQGVLLLNTVLSVRAGVAGSHRRKGWEEVTAAILRALLHSESRIVFLLWGRVAQAAMPVPSAPHIVLEAGHPSPLSVRHFRACAHFSAANDALLAVGRGPAVRW